MSRLSVHLLSKIDHLQFTSSTFCSIPISIWNLPSFFTVTHHCIAWRKQICINFDRTFCLSNVLQPNDEASSLLFQCIDDEEEEEEDKLPDVRRLISDGADVNWTNEDVNWTNEVQYSTFCSMDILFLHTVLLIRSPRNTINEFMLFVIRSSDIRK